MVGGSEQEVREEIKENGCEDHEYYLYSFSWGAVAQGSVTVGLTD